MRTLILTVLLTLVSFTSFAKTTTFPNDKLCRTHEITKRYELELNRAWWYQGTIDSGYNQVRVTAPNFSYNRNGVLGCTTLIIMKNNRTGKEQKYFSAFTVTKEHSLSKVTLKRPITFSMPVRK